MFKTSYCGTYRSIIEYLLKLIREVEFVILLIIILVSEIEYLII